MVEALAGKTFAAHIGSLKMIANIRRPVEQDASRLAQKLHFTPWVHRHLGWRDALDFIHNEAFWLLADDQDDLSAALCLPPESNGVAWLQLFADFTPDSDRMKSDWQILWGQAQTYLRRFAPLTVAALVLQDWMLQLLRDSGFYIQEHIVNLELYLQQAPEPQPRRETWQLRALQPGDLPQVAALDAAAFQPLWQNPLPDLQKAYQRAVWAAVAEQEGDIIGYLIAIRSLMGVHISRLAVAPQAQGQGVGQALCTDLLRSAWKRGWRQITVNTQESNTASLRLYHRLGFHEDEERLPVYVFSLEA